MPKGTPPEKLLLASRGFAREQFSLKHRYALTMYTDQDHPHAHLVVKTVIEDGKRLNIRKAVLRAWRRLFAQQLRAHGIAGDATERALRGQTRSSFNDGIHRASFWAIPDICLSACSVSPRSSVKKAPSQTPERRSSLKPAAR